MTTLAVLAVSKAVEFEWNLFVLYLSSQHAQKPQTECYLTRLNAILSYYYSLLIGVLDIILSYPPWNESCISEEAIIMFLKTQYEHSIPK